MTDFLMQKADRVLVAAAKGFGLAHTRELKFVAADSPEPQAIIDARLAAVYVLNCDLHMDDGAIMTLLGGTLEGVGLYAAHAKVVVNQKLRDFPEHITRIREQIAA